MGEGAGYRVRIENPIGQIQMNTIVSLGRIALRIAACAFVLFPFRGVVAAPTNAGQVRAAVQTWLASMRQEKEMKLGGRIQRIVTRNDGENGEPLYHIVYLTDDGMVTKGQLIVSGDDEVEPILAISQGASFGVSPGDPMQAMVKRHTMAMARQLHAPGPRDLKAQAVAKRAKARWKQLTPPVSSSSGVIIIGPGPTPAPPPVVEKRVAPLVQTVWGQTNDLMGGLPCYNYYTPPNSPGSASNYGCGQVATAVGQIMRYWEYPQGPVGTAQFPIQVSGTATSASLMGGNGAGGPYDWQAMYYGFVVPGQFSVPLPTGPLPPSDAAAQAVGRLLHDVALIAQTNFAPGTSVGSLDVAVTELLNTFHYSNAVDVYAESSISTDSLLSMITPSIEAGSPVCLGYSDNGGFVVVCDGYVYVNGVRLYHINLGMDTAYWYALPELDIGGYNKYSVVDECVFNIFPVGTGEIISGRVTDGDGVPLNGVRITATAPGGATYTGTSGYGTGVYGIRGVPASTQFTMSATSTGYYFPPRTVSTGSSVSGPWGIGNANPGSVGSISGIDFVAGKAALSVVADPINGGTVTGDGTFPVNASREISATPYIGWTFDGWNDFVTTNPRTVTVPLEGASYIAKFTPDDVAWLNSPDYGSSFGSDTATFQWTKGGKATQYALWIGSTPNGYDIYSKAEGKALSDTVRIPVDGRSIYVTVWSMVDGQWQQAPSIRYTSWMAMKARITSPPNNSTYKYGLPLTWDGGVGASRLILSVGLTPQGHELFSGEIVPNAAFNFGPGLTARASGKIYATLWSCVGGKWQANGYVFNADPSMLTTASVLTSPAENTVLPGSSVTFSWSPCLLSSGYALFVGSAPGKYDLYAKAEGLALSDTVTLPADGSPVYATVWTSMGMPSKWVPSMSYAFTTATNPAPAGPVKSVLSSPANNSTLAAGSTTFAWTSGSGATQYALIIGSTPGGHDIYAKIEGSALADTVNLPTDGRQVYVALLSLINGKWVTGNYVYTAYTAPGSAIAGVTSPADNSTFTDSSVTFTWSACSRATQYALFVGNSPGSYELCAKLEGAALSDTVKIPADGGPVYVTVWSCVDKQWMQSETRIYKTFTP